MKEPPNSKNLGLGGVAMMAAAIGAVAVGAFAIGALAIRRLAIDRAKFKSLEIQDLTVKRLHVDEVIVAGSLRLPPTAVDREFEDQRQRRMQN